MAKRRNFVIFQADQMAAPALDLYGGYAKTPNLAAIAEEGALFENFYCNYPLCAPSRFSMLTGQRAMSIGAFDNASEFPSELPTLAHYLRGAGYRTCLSGKMHFIGPDQLHGFEQRLTTDIYPADFAWLPDWETRAQGWSPIRDTIEKGGVTSYNMQLAYDEDVIFQAVRQIYDYARDPEAPFFLFVSMTHPHHPFLVTPEYWDRHAHDDIPMPLVERLDESQVDRHSARVRRILGLTDSDVTDAQRRAARHAYFAAINYVDDKVGTVMAALRATGLLDDTVILLTSDHGEMLGERGLWAKDCFFEWAMRIPLLMKVPGLPGCRRVAGNASLVDLLPTVLELADIGVDALAESIDGRSLVRQLTELDPEASDRVVAEYCAEAAEEPMVMIRQGRHKFIHAPSDPPQLFDLENDPDELENLAADPAMAAPRAAFEAAVTRDWDLAEIDKAIRLSQRRRALVAGALAVGQHKSWDFAPDRDYSKTYVRGAIGNEAADQKIRLPAKGHPFAAPG